MDATEIERRILQAMPDADVSVESGDNVHYTARVVSARFRDCSRIQRHRRVHEAIGGALGQEIHALSLVLQTPEEADV